MTVKSAALFRCLSDDLRETLPADLIPLLGKKIYPPDLSISQRAALSLSNSLIGKLAEDVNPDADAKALLKFLRANEKCGRWEPVPETITDEYLLNGFKEAVWRFFNWGGYELELDPVRLAFAGRVGPGSSVGARGQDFYTKLFDGPLTTTDDALYRLYKRAVQKHTTWHDAEEARSKEYGGGKLVKGSRLSFVPKTTDISRTICTEPVLNMWYQLSCYDALALQLRQATGIDLTCQADRNRELARLGSLGYGFTTIDLESASDSISLGLVEWALPPRIVNDLKRYRCAQTSLPDGTDLHLHMISSMGNGYTFPLQTIIFACVVFAVYRLMNIPVHKPGGPKGHLGNFGVFGDDIICLDSTSRLVRRLLGLLGFTVNEQKSFSEGPFRESCGRDYYHGRNVRGVYLKSLTHPAIYSAINLLVEFSARTGVSVPRVCRLLRSWVPWMPVPLWENNDAGIKTHPSFFTPKIDRNGSYAYYAWRPRSVGLRVLEASIAAPKRQRPRGFNPQGLLVSFLGGYLTGQRVLVRHDEPLYDRKRCVAPNWIYGCLTQAASVRTEVDWRRWESAFYLSL